MIAVGTLYEMRGFYMESLLFFQSMNCNSPALFVNTYMFSHC